MDESDKFEQDGQAHYIFEFLCKQGLFLKCNL